MGRGLLDGRQYGFTHSNSRVTLVVFVVRRERRLRGGAVIGGLLYRGLAGSRTLSWQRGSSKRGELLELLIILASFWWCRPCVIPYLIRHGGNIHRLLRIMLLQGQVSDAQLQGVSRTQRCDAEHSAEAHCCTLPKR